MAILVRHLSWQQTDKTTCETCGKSTYPQTIEIGGKHDGVVINNPLYICGTCHKEVFSSKEIIFGGSVEYEEYLEHIYLKEIMRL